MRARSLLGVVMAAVLASGCEPVEPPPAARCVAPAGPSAVVPSETVCARLQGLGCLLPECPAAYASFAARAAPEDFGRLTACYMAAASCDEVDQCARACGPDGGAIPLAPPRDAGSAEAGTDARVADDAATDAAGAVDAGAVEAGAVDGGAADASAADASVVDAGAVDAGAVDAGRADDAGAADMDAAPDAG